MCDKAWEKGVPAPDPTKYPVWMKPSQQCSFEVDGKRAYIAAKDEDSLREFIDANPVVTTLDDAAEGVYTWLLYRKKKGGKLKFAAAKVQSVLEIATLHRAIAYVTKAETIHGAGELKKTETKLRVNAQSGSFMVEWKKTLPEGCSLTDMGNFVLEKVKPFLPAEGLEVYAYTREDKDKDVTFIEGKSLEPSKEELDSYEKRGLTVCYYETEKECKSDKAKKCKDETGGRRKTRRRKTKRRVTRRW
jgi:hypothetical protein